MTECTASRSPQLAGNAEQRRRGVLATACGAHFIHDGVSDSLYVLLPVWAQAFGLSYAEVGALRTAFAASGALFQVPAGMLAERFGERILLCLGTVLAGAAFALFALAGGHGQLLVLILIAGIGSATQHPLASSLVSKTYDQQGRRAALGVYNFSGDLGKMTVAFLLASAVGYFGWRAGAAGYGLIVVLAGVAVLASLALLAAGAAPVRAPANAESRGERSRLDDWGIHNQQGFAALSAIEMLDCMSRIGFLTFLPFLMLEKGASAGTIGLALALVFAGGAAGKLACGILAERMGLLATVIATEMLTGVLILLVALTPLIPALVLLPVLGVALNGTSSVLYGTVGEFVRADRQSRAFGLFYSLGSGANTLGPAVFGLIADRAGLLTVALILAVLAFLTLPVTLWLGRIMAGSISDRGAR